MAHKKIGSAAVAGALLFGSISAVPPDACAQEAGWYVGAGDLSKARMKASINTGRIAAGFASAATALDKSEQGWKIFGGYEFNQNLAVEGGYAALGNFSFTSTTVPAGTLRGTTEPGAWTLDAVGTLPLVYNFSLFARAGVLRSETDFSVTSTGPTVVRLTQTDHDWGYHLGLGVAFNIWKNVTLRAEWERYRVSDGIGGSADVDLLALSFRITF